MAGKEMGSSRSEASLSMGTNPRMSSQRREKLINLKKREDLKDALVDKFKTRFGTGAKDRGPDESSVASSAIRREVDHFAAAADVTEANLGRLERRLQGTAKKQLNSAACVEKVSMYSGASHARSCGSLGSAGQQMVESKKPDSFDWARLDEYASFLHEQDAVRQKIGVTALQRKLRMDLDAQVKEKASKRGQAEEEERRYHQNSMVELERWKQTEQMRAEELHQKLMREKADRDAQLDFERKLKNDESQRKKNEESALVEKIVNEMETEQKKFERKKETRKRAMRAVFEENNEDMRKRTEANRQQQEREAAAMAEYNRILDEQEEQRAEELGNRMARQKELMDKLQANTAAQAKDAGDNDAQRANAQQAEMDRHYFEAEKTKMGRLKQMRLENQSYLLKQMGEKDGRKGEDQHLASIQSQILEKDTEEYNAIERQKAINKRVEMFENRKIVEQQIEHRAGVRAPAMSDSEMALNRPLLNLVERTLQQRDQTMQEAF